MRIFKTSPFGDECDLDDPKLYSYLPDDFYELRNILFKEIGYSYWYMNYLHNYSGYLGFESQKERIHIMIKDFTDNYNENINNIMWIKEKIFLFQNEIENMC